MSKEDRDRIELEMRVKWLADQNQKAIDALGRKGVGINPADIFHMRVETFINVVLGKPDDSIQRLEFEERYQEALAKALSATETAAEKAIRERDKQERLNKLRVVPPNSHGERQ